MKKDVIYIDTEDDITSIIDKVKASSEKIVALVPPKRVGVLQSAVNLKLLQKSAKASHKQLVIITANKSLSALAAGVTIPVAKNLHTKPEIAVVNAMPDDSADVDEDVIEGDDLPVGELASTAPSNGDDEEDIELPDDISLAGKSPKKSKAKKTGPNIPNFDVFRKKLFLFAAGGVLLLLFLIWAVFFAPHATVKIKANTTSEDLNIPVSLTVDGSTNIDSKTLKTSVEQLKKTFSSDFTATGKKEIGTKATGSVTISNCATTSSITIPAGTAVSSDGLNFITASSVSVPGGASSVPFGPCTIPGKATASVQAQNVGENYNLASDSDFTVAGQGSAVSATNKNAFTGGTKRTATVVSQTDVDNAKSKIIEDNKDAGKEELEGEYNEKNYVIIDESYKADATNVSSSPAVDSEASKARLTVEITYTLLALDRTDVNQLLNAELQDEVDEKENQRIYDNGIDELVFENPTDSSVNMKTTAYIGPDINTKNLKPQLVGKNYEEIRQIIKQYEGVQDVETEFSPFWVSKAPGEDKIDIKFVVKKDE